MNVLAIILFLGAFYAINMVLSFRQSKDLANSYVALRRQGRVVMGKYKRLLNSGAIVLFAINDDNTIIDAKILSGYTVFSRFKDHPELLGMDMNLVGLEDWSTYPKHIRKAIENASTNYHRFITGQEVVEPDSPIIRLGKQLTSAKKK